jgi:hypothetical protein
LLTTRVVPQGLGLVFVAVYQQSLSLLYVEELLELVKAEFLQVYTPSKHNFQKFDATFERLLRDCETKADATKRAPQQKITPANSKVRAVPLLRCVHLAVLMARACCAGCEEASRWNPRGG